MQAPAGDAGDFLAAYGTTSVLVVPEKAKNFRTPKCISHMGPFAICEVGLPSSQTPLLGPSPLRTVHASFPAHSSSPTNASFKETRLGYGKMLTVNPVVALWMEQNAVFSTLRTTLHERDAMVKAPARDSSDLGIANSAEATLFLQRKRRVLVPRNVSSM